MHVGAVREPVHPKPERSNARRGGSRTAPTFAYGEKLTYNCDSRKVTISETKRSREGQMTKKQKRLAKIKANPKQVRFNDLASILRDAEPKGLTYYLQLEYPTIIRKMPDGMYCAQISLLKGCAAYGKSADWGLGEAIVGGLVTPDTDSGFGVRDSGFGIRGSGFGVRSSGFGIRGSGFGVRGSHVREGLSTYRIPNLGFRSSGFSHS